jgi:thiol-disulfide isomerase/thioredoxin
MYDTDKLDRNSVGALNYIESIKRKAPQFLESYNSYELNEEVEIKLKCYRDKCVIYAFSAEWCPDCYKHIPVLAKIKEKTGLKTKIFGKLMRDAKNPNKRWKIPPSPEEVDLFEVKKIPSIFLIDNDGNKIGEIIEHPPQGKSLEVAILDILES